MTCVNTSHRDFQALKQKSGLSEETLIPYVSYYLDTYGVYPELNELPGSDSEGYLREQIQLDENDGTTIQNILDYTGAQSIEEAVVSLNKNHSDLQIEVLPINKEAIVRIQHKPSAFAFDESETLPQNSYLNSTVTLNNMVSKLNTLYGINIAAVTTEDLAKMELSPNIKGMILDGKILINTDTATLDTPLHELVHLLIGGVRIKHPQLYAQLVDSADNIQTNLRQLYPNRTRLDLNEEIIVSELSKYMVGLPNAISELEDSYKNQIIKDFTSVLDSILMGTRSTEIVDPSDLFRYTLKSLGKIVNSRELADKFDEHLNRAYITRQVANLKESLLKKDELIEQCI